MGSFISSSLGEQFRKQRDAQIEAQKLMLERQLQMQQLMIERQASMRIAAAKDVFMYFVAASTVAAVGGVFGFRRSKNPMVFAPLFPLGFISTFYYDLSYGSKMERIRKDAENILVDNRYLVGLPLGPITFEEIETRRLEGEQLEAIAPNQLFL